MWKFLHMWSNFKMTIIRYGWGYANTLSMSSFGEKLEPGEVKTESVNIDCPLLVGTLFPFPDHQFEFSWEGGCQTDKTSWNWQKLAKVFPALEPSQPWKLDFRQNHKHKAFDVKFPHAKFNCIFLWVFCETFFVFNAKVVNIVRTRRECISKLPFTGKPLQYLHKPSRVGSVSYWYSTISSFSN